MPTVLQTPTRRILYCTQKLRIFLMTFLWVLFIKLKKYLLKHLGLMEYWHIYHMPAIGTTQKFYLMNTTFIVISPPSWSICVAFKSFKWGAAGVLSCSHSRRWLALTSVYSLAAVLTPHKLSIFSLVQHFLCWRIQLSISFLFILFFLCQSF